MNDGLSFRVQGLGIRVLGFRVQGLGLRFRDVMSGVAGLRMWGRLAAQSHRSFGSMLLSQVEGVWLRSIWHHKSGATCSWKGPVQGLGFRGFLGNLYKRTSVPFESPNPDLRKNPESLGLWVYGSGLGIKALNLKPLNPKPETPKTLKSEPI